MRAKLTRTTLPWLRASHSRNDDQRDWLSWTSGLAKGPTEGEEPNGRENVSGPGPISPSEHLSDSSFHKSPRIRCLRFGANVCLSRCNFSFVCTVQWMENTGHISLPCRYLSKYVVGGTYLRYPILPLPTLVSTKFSFGPPFYPCLVPLLEGAEDEAFVFPSPPFQP